MSEVKKHIVPQIVIFNAPFGYENKYPFTPHEALLFLGEIKNMQGHCVIANKEGKVYWGYDIDNFREPTENEI